MSRVSSFENMSGQQPATESEGLGAKISQAAGSVTEKAKEIAESAVERAEEAAASVKQRAEDLASSVTETASDVAERVRDQAGNLIDDAGNLIRRHPMPSLCVGLGLGLLLARLIRR